MEAGNDAAHRGNVSADSVLFYLGFLPVLFNDASPEDELVPTEQNSKTFYEILYRISLPSTSVMD